jgi:uncharacterized membrane-anchored protein
MNDNKTLRGLLWLGSAGALLIIGGIIAILAANWASVPFFLQVTLALTPLMASLGAALWYWKRKASTPEIEEVIGCAWTGSIICAIALLARILQLPSDGFAFCFTVTLLLTAVTGFMRSTMALVTQVAFLTAIATTRPAAFLFGERDYTLLTAMLLGGILLLPRLIELWKRTTVTATVLRYFASIWLCIYVLILHFLIKGGNPFVVAIFNLTFLSGLLFLLAVWVEQHRPAWNRPLMSFSMLFMDITCITDCLTTSTGFDWIFGILSFILLGIFFRKLIRTDLFLIILVPTVMLFSPKGINFLIALLQGKSISLEIFQMPGNWIGNLLIIAIATALLIIGLLRASRFVANFALLFLLGFCFSLLAEYDVKLMTLGIIFIVCGLLFWLTNLYFARLAERLNRRFPSLITPYYLPTRTLSAKTLTIFKRITLVIALFCCVGQLLVPSWMLVKRHLILTQGERIELAVTIYDPRDLFAGRYVQLNCTNLPDALKDVKARNYLRYYCDERYAQAFENALRKEEKATLIVRVWHKQALAEALFIDGKPAHDYVLEQRALAIASGEGVGCGEMMILCTPKDATEISPSGTPYLKKTNDPTTDKMRLPVLRNAEHIWDEVLNRLAIPRHAADIPHPTWMDLWVSGAPIPKAAFLPVTPFQRQTRRPTHAFFNWGSINESVMPPIFMGMPQGISTTKSFEEVADTYYAVLLEHYKVSNPHARNWDGKYLFSAIPPRDTVHAQAIFSALNKALPEAQWVIFATTHALPEGFPWDLPRNRITLVTATPPASDINWIYAPTAGTDFQQIARHCQDTTRQCKGWLNGEDKPAGTLDSYWNRSIHLLDHQTLTYSLEETLCQSLIDILKDTQTMTEYAEKGLLSKNTRELYTLATTWLRQKTTHNPTDEIAHAWLQRIESVLIQDLQMRAYHAFTHSEDYAQWHLRNFGTHPKWDSLTIPDASSLLSRETWLQFIQDFNLEDKLKNE